MATEGRAVKQFELGVVYSRGAAFYLAVDFDKLLSKNGNVREIDAARRRAYNAERSMQFQDLELAWELTADEIDRLVGTLLTGTVRPAESKRPRGNGRAKPSIGAAFLSRFKPPGD